MHNVRVKNTAKYEHTTPYYCINLISRKCASHYFLADYSHFMEIRLRYPNTAVTYSNTAVRKGDMFSQLYSLDFECMILNA